jgi:hypothetical protein
MAIILTQPITVTSQHLRTLNPRCENVELLYTYFRIITHNNCYILMSDKDNFGISEIIVGDD